MPLQDLTPQLRTRLNRMERAVGWFVLVATLLLFSGFGYYLYKTAERKGWFKRKATFYIYANRATGIKVGDPVTLMGFEVGEVTVVTAEKATDFEHNVYLEFDIKEPYIGYLWTEGSRARLTAADLLGKRVIEVTKGTNGYPIYLFHPMEQIGVHEAGDLPDLEKWRLGEEVFDGTGTNRVLKAWAPLTRALLEQAAEWRKTIHVIDTRQERREATVVWNRQDRKYEAWEGFVNIAQLDNDESAALNERAERLLSQLEAALPNFLQLTNDLNRVLANSTEMTSNLNVVAKNVQPAVTNLSAISAQLREPGGALGRWLIPTNTQEQLDATLASANNTLVSANTNMALVAGELARSLDNLANITSNLNNQVVVNSNILSEISDIVVHSDQFVQGLKRHWLLRSAFRTPKTNAPSAGRPGPLRSPKAASQ